MITSALIWSILIKFLFCEVFAVIFILLLPLVESRHWNKLHKFRILAVIAERRDAVFVSLFVPLSVLTIHSVWQVFRLPLPTFDADKLTNLLALQSSAFIAGSATLLWFLIWCAARLMYRLASLESELTIARQRLADGAVAVAIATAAATTSSPTGSSVDRLLSSASSSEGARRANSAAAATATNALADESSRRPSMAVVVEAAVEAERTRRELAETRLALERALERLHRAELDLSAMRRQAEGANRAFDELLEEHSRLQLPQGVKKYN